MISNLVTYSDSSGDDDDSNHTFENESRKRKIVSATDEETAAKNKTIKVNSTIKRLPSVPDDIQKMFASTDDAVGHGDPSIYEGRQRSFAHERGNWASYVFLPTGLDEVLSDLALTLVSDLEFDLKVVDDLHISLSRTVVLRHHWIDSFVSSLQDQLSSFRGFACEFDRLAIYCNDEKTRTFIGLKVGAGSSKLKDLTDSVDKCLDAFRLPKYYENASFHVSIAWALGDVTQQLQSQEIQQKMQEILEEQFEVYPNLRVLSVKEIQCKIGNRFYNIALNKR